LLTPGVVSIVGFGGHPAPVGEEELAAIQRMLTSGLRLQPWPYLRAGQRVWIERGPLGGLEGILVRSKDYWRVVVNVELLQRSVAVEIDRDALSPVASAAQPVARPAVSCTCA
jgi:transcription antitermination factor NusG